MAVPDFQSLMLPALKVLSDGKATPAAEIREGVAKAETWCFQGVPPVTRLPVVA